LDLKATAAYYADTTNFNNVHFTCEVIVMMFLDPAKAPYQITKLAMATPFNDNKTITIYENTTLKVRYIGLYVQMYGRESDGDGPYYFAEYGGGQDRHMGGFAQYTMYLSADHIIQPLLTKERVTPYESRSYNDYTYHVMYSDENNHPPADALIQIDSFPPVDMKFVDFNYTTGNYRDGAFYEFTINGVKLGLGWHTYTFIFKDHDGYARRASIPFKGPFISDNIEPQIRITATETIEIMEDSGHHYVDLLEIFDDVDEDPMTFKILQDDNWVSTLESDLATFTVWANDTVRITPKENKHGEINIYLNATDDNKAWVKNPFELIVKIIDVNDPPQIKKFLGEWKIKEDSILTGLNLNDYFHDPIETEQVLTFDYEEEDHLMVSIEYGGEVIITPDDDWNGDVAIRFSASDGTDTIYNVMRLKVESVNDLPVFVNPHGFTINEGHWFEIDLEAYDPIEGEEVHIETNLSKEVNTKLLQKGRIAKVEQGGVVLGENLILEKDPTDDSITKFSFRPTNEMAGSLGGTFSGIYYVSFSAVDASGGTITYNVIMTIMNINNPPEPVIKRPENGTTFLINDFIHFFGESGDPDYLHGYDNTYLWSSSLDGELGRERHLSKVRLNTTGKHTITLEVGDGESTSRTTIQINVITEVTGDSDDGVVESFELLGLSSAESNILLLVIAIIILVILSFAAVVMAMHTKNRATKGAEKEPEARLLKLPTEVQDLLAPQKVICSHCKSIIAVVSKRRPLSVSCHECGKKSVVFHPGRAAFQQDFLLDEEEGEEPAELKGKPSEPDQKLLPPGGN
jgi:hypothetical protein